MVVFPCLTSGNPVTSGAESFPEGPSPFSPLPLEGRAYCPRVLEVQSHKMAEARDFFTHLLLFSDGLQRHEFMVLYSTVSSGNREGTLGSSRGRRGGGLLYKQGSVNHRQG